MKNEQNSKEKSSESGQKKEKNEFKLTVPDLIPVNDRIYTRSLKQDHLTKGGLIVPQSSTVMGGTLFMVVACDPTIKYTDYKGIERKLDIGDIVRPFAIESAGGYKHVTDTFMGESYIIFHWTEIASVVPKDMSNIEFGE
jgi:co-chaperonin GroES (HSP10)